MPDQKTLVQIAKLVAKDISVGRMGDNSWTARQAIETDPETALDLIALLAAEHGKKKRNAALVSAYAYLFEHALENIRFGVEAGQTPASLLADRVREALLRLGSSDTADPALLLLLLSQFAAAKLDPGAALREVMVELMEGADALPGAEGDEDPDRYIQELAASLNGDAFALYDQLREMAGALPDPHRAAFGVSLVHSEVAAAREAAVGWLLDPAAEVRDAVAAAIGQSAALGTVSGTMLRRMITLRNWLPEDGRAALDHATQSCRRAGVDCASWPASQARDIFASMIDGAGAQSIFLLCRQGREDSLGCLLFKHGIGVRDAWARHGLAKAELEEFMDTAFAGMDLLPVDPSFIQLAISHFLAVNLDSGVMPGFATLDVLECAGLPQLQPRITTPTALLDRIEEGNGGDPFPPEMLKDLLAAGGRLPAEYDALESWFENDDAVEGLLGEARMTRPRQVAAVLEQLLPAHRERWTALLAWTAFTLQQSEEEEPWEAFFATGRAVAEARLPLADIPLMRLVAEQTVEAFRATARTRDASPAKGKAPARKAARSTSVPKAMQARYDEIVRLTDQTCDAHLNAEYKDLARAMAAALCRKRPSPVASGQPKSWACGILYTLGQINFLSDRASEPYMTLADLCTACGVGASTGSAKARVIADALDPAPFDPDWTLPSLLDENPMVWMAEVNGLLVDLRDMPREVQEVAFQRGMIPYIPADRE